MSKNYGFVGNLHLRELDNGDLQIAVSEEYRAELQRYADEDEYTWSEINEMIEEPFYTDGGSFSFFADAADYDLGMTNSPVITFDTGYDDDNEVTYFTKIWWHPNYMIEDWREILINQGEFIFTKGD